MQSLSVDAMFCPAGKFQDPFPFCSDCTPGYYCTGGSSPPIACAAGTFCPEGAAAETTCSAGNYCPAQSASETPCASGTYCLAGSSSETTCPAGSFCATTDVAPVTCTAGNYCPEGSTSETACASGNYCLAGSSVETVCPAGSFCATTDAAPVTCTAGNYCPEGATTETSCAAGNYCLAGADSETVCPAGSFCATTDASPVTCTAGNYCPEGATTETACTSGNYCLAGADSETVCPAGSFCATTDAAPVTCTAGNYCPEGSSAETACTSGNYCLVGADSETICPAGSFCATTDAAPVTCTAGNFCPEGSSTETACTAGNYCPVGASTETACSAGTYCLGGASAETVCPGGSFCATTDAAPVTCSAGTYCPAGSTAETTCFPGMYCLAGVSNFTVCPAGSFCPTTDALPQTCTAGHYCSEASTSEIDCSLGNYCLAGASEETPCPAGSFCATVDAAPVQCPAGDYCVTSSTASTPCSAGSFCPAGSSSDSPCPGGTFCLTPDVSITCSAGNYCPAGSQSETACSVGNYCLSGSSAETECPAGSFCATVDAAPVTCPAGDYCPAGTVTPVECSAGFYCAAGVSSETACTLGNYCLAGSSSETQCTAGDYCPTVDAAPLICPAGYYCPAGTVTPTICPIGSYCPEGSDDHTICPPGFYCLVEGISAADIVILCNPGEHQIPGPVCDACPAGSYCPGGGSPAFFCTAGNYCPAGASAQTQCAAGTYCPPAASAETPCTSGNYCLAGSGEETVCPGGSVCATVDAAPVQCAAGNYCPEGATSQTACDAGEYCLAGSSNFTICPAGSFCATTDAAPVACTAGNYCPTGSTAETACGTGTYCLAGAAAETTCPAGSFCATTDAAPALCTAGNYCPLGSDSEAACSSGTYCLAGAPAETTCPAGAFCATTDAAPANCTAGNFCPLGSTSETPCTSGNYCLAQADSETQCPGGSFCATVDAAPVECAAGTYCPPGSTAETPCTAGNYCPAGASSETACVSGSYCLVGAGAETICPAGSFCATTDAAPVTCSAGNYCPLGSVSETVCTFGFYCLAGADAPITCPAGSFCVTPDVAPQLCTAGSFCPLGSTTTQPCSSGSFCPEGTAEEADCPGGTYCTTPAESANCTGGNYCPEGSTAETVCSAGNYCPAQSAAEIPCTPGQYCLAGSSAFTTCPAGSYCPSVSVDMVIVCPFGFYCPAESAAAVECPNGEITDPETGAVSIAACQTPECGNGYLEPGEDCDDGENFNGDGCDGFCKFEDSCGCANGTEWLCTAPTRNLTSCCPSYYNPVTEEWGCGCVTQVSPDAGYVVLDDCTKQDVDECADNNGGCLPEAVCTNLDGTLGAGTHYCTCPSGRVGDGIVRCDVFLYLTHMSFELAGITSDQIDVQELKQNLTNEASVFPGRDVNDYIINLVDYTDSALQRPEEEYNDPIFTPSRRRLLQRPPGFPNYGTNMFVSVISQSAFDMEDLTSAVDQNGITTLLADWYNVAVNVLQGPQNAVSSVDRVYGAVNTVLTGFVVEGIVYNTTSLEWLVTVKYVPNARRTITSPYVTRAGSPPYSSDVEDTYFISKHPCMRSRSVCCLNDYVTDYHTGDFKNTVDTEIGTCDATVRNMDTLDLFDPDDNELFVMGALSELDYSYVTRLADNRLQFHINRFALRDQVAMREPIAGGYKMDYFVGMSYFTLLPTNVLATVASQVSIHVTATDAVMFATSSEQDYTFLEHITMSLYQTKYVDEFLNTHNMQFVKMAFVFPDTFEQNMDSGLIPLTDIRFAISEVVPDVLSNAWVNPCYSDDNTGLYDNVTSSMRMLYTEASHQQCALQPDFCMNPPTATIESGYAEIWLPIGENTITDAMWENSDTNYLYVSFMVATKRGMKKAFAKLFAQAPLSEVSFTKACEELEAAQSIADIAEVDLDVGMVRYEADWDNGVTQFVDLLKTSRENGILNTGLTVQAESMESGLLTLAVRGRPELFENPLAANFRFELEDLTTLHFLDDNKYNSILSLAATGDAWDMVREENTGYLQVALSFDAANICLQETIPGDFTCAVRKNIFRRQVVWDYAVHQMATGVGTTDEAATAAWLQEHILGGSTDFSRDFSERFTTLTRDKHNINDRYNKAWFVNPMYRWAMDPDADQDVLLSLTDKTILVAILVMEDGNYAYGSGGGVRRRFLLQAQSDGDRVTQVMREIGAQGAQGTLPPLRNQAIWNDFEIARMVGIHEEQWVKMRLNVQLSSPATWTKSMVRNEMQRIVNENRDVYGKQWKFLHLVQFHMEPGADVSRRRLLSGNESVIDWDGFINVMMVAKEEFRGDVGIDPVLPEIYENWFRCAFYTANITTDRYGSPISECGQPTTQPIRGFVTDYFLDTCNNYSSPFRITDCNDVILFMDNPTGSVPEVQLPPGNASWVGYRITLWFADDRLNTETFNAFDRNAVKKIIARKFTVHHSQVVYRIGVTIDDAEAAAAEFNGASRRLLDMTTAWDVMVPTNWDWDRFPDLETIQDEIELAIEDELNFEVILSIASYVFANGDTPAPVGADGNTVDPADGDGVDGIYQILAIVALVLLVLSILGSLAACFLCPAVFGLRRETEEERKQREAREAARKVATASMAYMQPPQGQMASMFNMPYGGATASAYQYRPVPNTAVGYSGVPAAVMPYRV